MYFEINKEAVYNMIIKAVKVTDTKMNGNAMNGIYIECSEEKQEISMFAVNSGMWLILSEKASVFESGNMVLDSKILFKIISLAYGDIIEFKTNDDCNTVRISYGSSVFDIIFLDGNKYSKPMAKMPEEVIHISGICDILRKTNCIDTEINTENSLKFISLRAYNGAIQMAACGRCSVSLVKYEIDSKYKSQFLLPQKPFQTLAAISDNEDEYSIGRTDNEIIFSKDGMLFGMITEDITFIDTDRVIKSVVPEYAAISQSNDLAKAFDFIIAGDETAIVSVAFLEDEIKLERSGAMSAVTRVHAKIKEKTPESGFFYKADSLIKIFKAIKGIVQIKIDRNGIMLIRGKNELYVMSAMSAKNEQIKGKAA